MQRDVAQIQAPPGAERITRSDIMTAETFVICDSEKPPLVVSNSTSRTKLSITFNAKLCPITLNTGEQKIPKLTERNKMELLYPQKQEEQV